jgi:hypothetical protein
MILISHRGNINGILPKKENTHLYVDECLNLKYDCEIDIWYLDNKFYLGHDNPSEETDLLWLNKRKKTLWMHCKNTDCLYEFLQTDFNYFWHENDLISLTSHKYIWAYPGKQPIRNSIAVLPEKFKDDTSYCIGICSDVIKNYKILYDSNSNK